MRIVQARTNFCCCFRTRWPTWTASFSPVLTAQRPLLAAHSSLSVLSVDKCLNVIVKSGYLPNSSAAEFINRYSTTVAIRARTQVETCAAKIATMRLSINELKLRLCDNDDDKDNYNYASQKEEVKSISKSPNLQLWLQESRPQGLHAENNSQLKDHGKGIGFRISLYP